MNKRIEEIEAEIAKLNQELETLKAEPEVFEGWVNTYGSRAKVRSSYPEAAMNAASHAIRTAVRVREVLPRKRWRAINCAVYPYGPNGSGYIAEGAERIVQAHNAEMERITGTTGEE